MGRKGVLQLVAMIAWEVTLQPFKQKDVGLGLYWLSSVGVFVVEGFFVQFAVYQEGEFLT